MSSEYDMKSLMEKNKPQLQEIVTPITMAAITDQHWLAVVGVLTSVEESQDKVIKILGRTRANMSDSARNGSNLKKIS